MADGDLFVRLAKAIGTLFDDALDHLTDQAARAAMLRRLGLAVPSTPPADDTAARSALSALQSSAANDLATILVSLAQAGDAVVAVVQDAAAGNPGTTADTILAGILQILAVDAALDRAPLLWALGSGLRVFDDGILSFDRIVRFFGDPGAYLQEVTDGPDDERRAANWSALLGLIGLGTSFIPDIAFGHGASKGTLAVPTLYGWDPDPHSTHPNAEAVLARTLSVGVDAKLARSGIDEGAITLTFMVVPPEHGGGHWGLFVTAGGKVGITIPIGQHLELVITGVLTDGIETLIGPGGFVRSSIGTNTDAAVSLELRRKQEANETWKIGDDDKVHLEVSQFSVKGTLGTLRSSLVLGIDGGALVIPKEAAGWFLGLFLPSAGLELKATLGIGIDGVHGLYFEGGTGFDVTLPINQTVIGLTIRTIRLELEAQNGPPAGLELRITGAFSLSVFGKVVASVEGIGMKADLTFPSDGTGNLGKSANIELAFQAPSGLGLAIDFGIVKGGGYLFFDPAKEEYGGVLELTLSLTSLGISIKAFGLINELPDGTFSFIVVLSAEFNPPFEIFLGFTFNGVGGLLGINRGINLDALRSGLHDGAVSNLLFPDDPVARAPAILATLRGVFPPVGGHTLVGLMVKLGWGRPVSFVTVTLGVVIAAPNPTVLAILGELRIAVPVPDLAIVDLRADFLGTINFDTGEVAFDASLTQSNIVGFPITGDLALRAGSVGFFFSAGGFHPRFSPPANVPALRRVGMDISEGPLVRIRLEGYLAITSNTFQLGARAQLDIAAGPFSVHGFIEFDALVRWEPRFWFSVELSAGLELRSGGTVLLSLSVDLLLEGPGPWHAKGSASFHVLFITISVGFDTTWGDTELDTPASTGSALQAVKDAVGDPQSWAGELPPSASALVTLRAVTREAVALHPLGTATVRQHVLPLGVRIDRMGTTRPTDAHTVGLGAVALSGGGNVIATPSQGRFAPAQFFDLTDDQKLSRPSFEPMQDGVTLSTAAVASGAAVRTDTTYETILIGADPPYTLRFKLFVRSQHHIDIDRLDHVLASGAVARSGLHHAIVNAGPSRAVVVADEQVRVATTDTLHPATGVLATPTASPTVAYRAIEDAVTADPSLADRLQVVGIHEVTT